MIRLRVIGCMALFGCGLVADYFENRRQTLFHTANCASVRCKSLPSIVSSSSSEHLANMVTGTKRDVVLVTGGSGFVGQHIVKLLQEKDHVVDEIRVFDCKPYMNTLGHKDRLPVRYIQGDLCSAEQVRDALQGVGTVIHTAGVVSFGTFPDIEAMQKVNVSGTENLIEACIAENVPRLVFTSTIDVVIGYDEIIDGDETQPVPDVFLFPGYPETKYRAESLVLAANGRNLAGSENRLHTVSLRPNVMYGEGDPYFIPNGLRAAKKNCGKLPRIGNGKALFQQAYVGNTAWAHILAVRALRKNPEQIGGRSFFIPDDTPLCNSFDFMEPFLKAHGFALATWSIPYPVIYSMLYMAETLFKYMAPIYKINMETPLCSIIYINKTYYFNRNLAEKLLSYKPLYSYQESLDNCLPYYSVLDL